MSDTPGPSPGGIRWQWIICLDVPVGLLLIAVSMRRRLACCFVTRRLHACGR